MRRRLSIAIVVAVVGLVLIWTRLEREPDAPLVAVHAASEPRSASRDARFDLPTPPPIQRASNAPPQVDPDPSLLQSESGLGSPTFADGPAESDPIQDGECTLELTVFSDSNGLPVPGDVELWRLAAPGNEHWSAGDQLQASQRFENGHGRFERLPEGRYRVFSHVRRASAVDPPPFDVHGPLTRVEVRVELPRGYVLLLDVRDETGLFLERASLAPPKDSMTLAAPDWIQARSPLSGASEWGVHAVEWNSHQAPREIVAGPLGFELGEFTEATPRSGRSRHALLSFPGRSSVRCPIQFQESDTARYIAPSIPIASLIEHVRTEDGSTPLPEQVTIAARATAVPRTALADPSAWRGIPIHIDIAAPGYAGLEVDYRLSDGPIPELLLRRP